MKRRAFIKAGLLSGGAILSGASVSQAATHSSRVQHSITQHPAWQPAVAAGIQQSVCKWCYPDFSVDELAAAAKEIGLRSVELLEPRDWDAVQKHGLTCAMAFGPMSIEAGFNDPAHHARLVPAYRARIREVDEAGLHNVICFSGNRNGMDDDEGLENCAQGLKEIMSAAEKHGVTVCMELLNSKVDHPDYMADHTAWGVELCERVGSDHFKLLYDIYHMQIMEGDVIRTIRDNYDYIAHYHTGGVPGRHEIDETQELNYPAIIRAIADTGYTGFIGQEFIPAHDPLTSLREAYDLCAV